jgi:hypothetical protein
MYDRPEMRTTLHLDDALLNHARREALRRGETLTFLIEKRLRLVLSDAGITRKRRQVGLPRGGWRNSSGRRPDSERSSA